MANDAENPLVSEAPSPACRLLRLNRPKASNALNMALRGRLLEELEAARSDAAVRAVVVTGNTDAFAAGADIREMKDASVVEIHARDIERFWREVGSFPKPLIAAVNGYALGAGMELALACDIIVAGPGATFGLPEVRLGIMPAGGGTQRLARVVGKHVALRYMLTGDRFGGEQAAQWGLVSELVPDEEVAARALALAEQIAQLPPLAVRRIKEATLKGLDASLETGLALERQSYYFLNATEDKAEGVAAFLEKRKPDFKGK